MNPLSMESLFLLLSGAILAAGVLYWFWSHIQLTQKKVQLLENAVFELRGMLVSVPGPSPSPSSPSSSGPSSSGPSSSSSSASDPVYTDLDDDADWSPSQAQESTPLEELNPDLQPGGRISSFPEVESMSPVEQFRELFVQDKEGKKEKGQKEKDQDKEKEVHESLESMPVKELRRLAEQRGLTGVSDMKKKELLSALRQQVSVPETVQEEKGSEESVDLVEDTAVLE